MMGETLDVRMGSKMGNDGWHWNDIAI